MSENDPLQHDVAVGLATLIAAAVFGAAALTIEALGGSDVWFLLAILMAACFLTMHDANMKDGFWRRAWETIPGVDIDDG